MKIDVSEATFQNEVIDRSFEAPVVIDFWAAWCGPCRALGPILERLADEADGEWVLAKVDVDQNPGLAQAFGVQGIPAVHAVKDGRPVANFTGALPEQQVRAWLRQLGPTEADGLVGEARAAEASGDLDEAAELLRRALAIEPAHDEARGDLAFVELKLRTGEHDEAELMRRLEADPSDVEAASGLADLTLSRGEIKPAFDLLLGVVQSTSGDERDRARVHLLSLFNVLPPDHPDVVAARRSLSLALF
ncbi:MAG TPA: tetratricopeptide repeat protein [Actinomycetota bacterium]|jgi:putative thioredoxin|nr:tetratricopeptide repeat protein [Actinomycetota bacterium]